MTRAGLLAGAAWSVLAPMAAAASPSPAASLPAATAAPSGQIDGFSPDDLLWMEVQADGRVLTESLNVYASRQGVYAPLGALVVSSQ